MMMRNRRSAGFSLFELMCSLAITGTIFTMLGWLGVVAFRWRDTAEASVQAATCADRVRHALLDAACGARPIDAVTAGGRSWKSTPEVLILTRREGTLVIAREGSRLVCWRLGGRATRETLGAGVDRVRFELARGEDGRARGIAFEVKVMGRSAPERGFVALRGEADQ
jgi:hypothetical protein